MKTVLSLNGGINKDINPLYVDTEKGEVTSRKNCRIYSNDGSRAGINCSIKGMKQYTAFFPMDGTNKCVGSVEDKERNKTYYAVYNSAGNHDIYEFNGTTITAFGANADVLGFTTRMVDMRVIGDSLILTDGITEPKKVNVVEGITGLTAIQITLANLPPTQKPTTDLGSDPTKVVNKLVGKTFQFAYYWVYDDETYSVLSPYSDIVVSPSVFSQEGTYEDSYIGNYVNVGYLLGDSRVARVKLVAREGNSGAWFVVEEYTKTDSTESRTVAFYNDVARKGLTDTEVVQLYSDVPRAANSVEIVQNRVVLGGVKKGYDKTEVAYTAEVEYENVTIAASSTPLALTDGVNSAGGYAYINIAMPVSVTEGQVLTVNITNGYFHNTTVDWEFFFSYSASYVVQAGDTVDDVMDFFMYDIQTKGKSIITEFIDGNLFDMAVASQEAVGGGVDLMFVGVYNSGDSTLLVYPDSTASIETPPEGVSTYKGGSWYNVGTLLYDDFGRTSGVLSPKRVYVPHAGERPFADAFDRARIKFTVNDASVPTWAKYMRFAVTESVNFAGVYPFVTPDEDTAAYETYLNGRDVIAINLPTNLKYEFRNGDYLVLEKLDVESAPTAITKTISKTIIGVEALITVSGTDTVGNWLVIPQGNETVTDYRACLAYIYRAKDTVEDLVYYEDSTTYTVTNGIIQTTTGYIGSGDAWYVLRKFKWGTDPSDEVSKVVEDFYLSVDDGIRAYSKGRPVVEFDTLGEVTLQDVVWSFNYLDGTKINGISTFNPLNRKQLDEKDGTIQRIVLVGDVLKVLQDNKETSLYIGKTAYRDGTGNLSVVRSNDFIGDAYPSVDDYGTRHPKSVTVYNRNLYYWDSDSRKVIRSSPNGQFPISDYGMQSLFATTNPANVISVYDEKNDEFIITLDNKTYAFKEGLNQWVAEYEFTNSAGTPPDLYGNLNTTTLAFLRDNLYVLEGDNSLYNVFFGSLKPLSVKGVVNIYPREEKCLRALELDSNLPVDVTITSPVTNTRPVGQKSILYSATWREREGNYVSQVFKNILGAGGVETLSLLHTGAEMVGKYLEVELSLTTNREVQIRNLTTNITINK